jgi:hypothetical protein
VTYISRPRCTRGTHETRFRRHAAIGAAPPVGLVVIFDRRLQRPASSKYERHSWTTASQFDRSAEGNHSIIKCFDHLFVGRKAYRALRQRVRSFAIPSLSVLDDQPQDHCRPSRLSIIGHAAQRRHSAPFSSPGQGKASRSDLSNRSDQCGRNPCVPENLNLTIGAHGVASLV